jgi:hypothetical protein
LPVEQKVIHDGEWLGPFRGRDSNQPNGALRQVRTAPDDHGRAGFGFEGDEEKPNHHVPRRQFCSSDSSASRRLKDADLNSFKSSSDQESDRSIFLSGG